MDGWIYLEAEGINHYSADSSSRLMVWLFQSKCLAEEKTGRKFPRPRVMMSFQIKLPNGGGNAVWRRNKGKSFEYNTQHSGTWAAINTYDGRFGDHILDTKMIWKQNADWIQTTTNTDNHAISLNGDIYVPYVKSTCCVCVLFSYVCLFCSCKQCKSE